jgi:CRP/FNR family transcriptional regulator, cyclic AMP receptor protein
VNVLALRLRETDRAVAADSFLTVKARLARALLELTEYLGEDSGAGRVLIRHKINQSDLAAMAGVARENVSRTLSDWKRRGLLTRSSGFYCVNDITMLKRYAADEWRGRVTTRYRNAGSPNGRVAVARDAAWQR